MFEWFHPLGYYRQGRALGHSRLGALGYVPITLIVAWYHRELVR